MFASWFACTLPRAFQSREGTSLVDVRGCGQHMVEFLWGLFPRFALYNAFSLSYQGRRPEPTIFPHTKRNTNDLPLVSDVIYNGSHREAHNSQRWDILGLTLVCFREWTDVLGSRNSCFDLAPGCLGESHKQGITGTVLE